MSMDLDKKYKTIKTIGIVIIIFLFLDVVTRCKAMRNAPELPIPSVITQKPIAMKMSTYVTQTGTTVAFNSVNLVARVEGYLNTISFTDGTYVKKGHPLFVIEPEPYMEKLLEAKATVAAQEANYAYAKSEYARQQKMYKQNATSLNNVEIWLAKSQEAAADIAKAKANQAIAEINYSYTHVSAPFDGRIGRHLIDIGNLVGNGMATNLATIQQVTPLYVYFNLNELDLLKLRDAVVAEGYGYNKTPHMPVYVTLQNRPDKEYEGTLDFVNNGLNASTGTLELRAILPNKDIALVPGLFVQVRVAITKPKPEFTVPDTAVLYDQIGNYLLTVDKENKVVLKRVELGSVEQGKRAILKGLDAQDNVIISGIQNATPGNIVAPQTDKQPTKSVNLGKTK